MANRTGQVVRKTAETEVRIQLGIDGHGEVHAKTGIGMLDHLLSLLAVHGRFDLRVEAQGDLAVDAHHTVEDVAIALGQALLQALGERRGIVRMGHALVPMDEALALVAVDLSGRGYPGVEVSFTGERVGDLPTDLARHFLESLALEGRFNLHARLLSGLNDHHRAEALFKALGRALDAASQVDPRLGGDIPSTKGTLEA